MHHGEALTDEDRQGWLEALRDHETAHPPGATSRHIVMTCSALKRHYRDILRGTRAPPGLQLPEHVAPPDAGALPAYFVYIKGEQALLWERITKREGHYMKPEMLESQLRTLESPEGEEGVVVVPLDLTTKEQVEVALVELKKQVPDLEVKPATP